MFTPKYRILLMSKCFPEDGIIGLGAQLISIFDSIKNYLSPHIWYASDIHAVGVNLEKRNFSNIQISLIGSDFQFIQYCSGIEQFTWGVFLCVDKRFSSQNVVGVQLETEDEPFRSINASGVLMEIRAFDTTYFVIYSDDFGLISKISNIYDVEIQRNGN
jgi:hypothetical protein